MSITRQFYLDFSLACLEKMTSEFLEANTSMLLFHKYIDYLGDPRKLYGKTEFFRAWKQLERIFSTVAQFYRSLMAYIYTANFRSCFYLQNLI